MTFKEIIINALIGILGLTLLCSLVGYIWWLSNLVNKMEIKETFINITLVSMAYLIPGIILLTSGMVLFIKTLIDPYEE